MAINKCEINGKISYQSAACPTYAKSKSLVKDKYISEQQLQKYKREHREKSEQGFRKLYPPKNPAVVSEKIPDNVQQTEPLQEQNKQTDKHEPPHVNVPRPFDYVNTKLEKMDRELDEHNKKLQQLQNTQ
ncbi:hypothetical protein bplSymb_SCF00508P013 [Bathymodiolus platifrons methanotrophic gill symbiont]|uniref:hypothetical protein n=1 Tax=Bathymodiolus platifrons methanotrophic gill symbiont TaxID=113268 RepID=UPI000B423553|nr:hypothetical protein [Bathymodiolus platifrons methanotrophic gill symbiont]TXL13161.1 hypothetical protein BMR05_12580 [Methylococcaceae bacterium HT4]TXL19203.1 hypothetical protein BMR06_11000 [Methylococcaceae bacterium HT5]GAW85331.1 hypothetical protein bplSymb_SCF00508P013 [Bathymodiolus platifrons methanotrophic gill symbiont]GFO73760.1 hypothetical protein BPLS_P0021 [Bathymodiolus platifrons methanotrophic gill symbiont]